MIHLRLRTTVALTIALGCAGCGLKGPLYLPDQVTNVEVRPAPTTPPASEVTPPPAVDGATESTEDESDDEGRSTSARPQD